MIVQARAVQAWWEQARAVQARILARLKISQETKHTHIVQSWIDSKDSSRKLQANCVISYFLTYI